MRHSLVEALVTGIMRLKMTQAKGLGPGQQEQEVISGSNVKVTLVG